MSVSDELKNLTVSLQMDVQEKNGVFTLSKTVAERKAFLSNKKLTYTAKLAFDDEENILTFSERLKESGFGMSGDSEISPGFGFKMERYKTGVGPREGTIEEQSTLFGKNYTYTFDFSKIRGLIEDKSSQLGYSFRYKIF
jgi:hypothetical protein